MMQGAAFVLGLSLVVCGLAIIGDALDLWKIPGDFWAALILVLATSSRWVQSRIPTRTPALEVDDRDPAPNGEKAGKSKTAVLLFFVGTAGAWWLALSLLYGCGSPEVRRDALAWAQCSGAGALQCIPAASNENTKKAAVDYAACVTARALSCASPYVARSNPPEPLPIRRAISLACVEGVAASGVIKARKDFQSPTGKSSSACVETKIARCFRGK